jgi:hypothetical protein
MTDQDHDKDKYLDELLDLALTTYSSAEPRPGLETRILAKVRDVENKAASPWRNWRWLWAGAAAALAIVLIVLFSGRHSAIPGPPGNVVQKNQPAAQPSPEVASMPPHNSGNAGIPLSKKRVPPHAERVALNIGPRQPIFPAPTPLSEQEKLLLSYYARTPREELIAQSHPDEPPVVAEDQSNIAVPEMIFVPQKSSNTR